MKNLCASKSFIFLIWLFHKESRRYVQPNKQLNTNDYKMEATNSTSVFPVQNLNVIYR